MNICCNKCQPNELVCESCGRTQCEQAHWHALPVCIQEQIARRINIEQHLADGLRDHTLEIIRLNSIIRELSHVQAQSDK